MISTLESLVFLTRRHIKVYFKDKATFFMSLFTPFLLIVLYIVFLKSVYVSSLYGCLADKALVSDSLANAFAASWLVSSIFATTPVTLAFCSNSIWVDDKIRHVDNDFRIAPVNPLVTCFSYFFANYIISLIICFLTLGVCFAYLAFTGWYLSWTDVGFIILAIFVMALFGSLLALISEYFVSSNGAIGATATLASSIYGFICGAYMPMSAFSSGIKSFVSFLPGTYGTILFRNYFMRGVASKIAETVPQENMKIIRDGFDLNFYFSGTQVSLAQCFLTLAIAVVVLLSVYVLIVFSANRSRSPKKRVVSVGEGKIH